MGIRFVYTALQVNDIDASEKFYTTILGMQKSVRKRVKETQGEMCVLKSGANVLELNWYDDAAVKKGDNLDHLAFEVDARGEFRRLMRTLRAKGIEVREYLETEGWNRFFTRDPDGNSVEIYVRKGG
jgi:catechol-2,3-dioxygenase